jgi:hypothetical protein
MVVGSAFVDGKPPLHPGSMVASTPDEAREAVRYVKRRGIDLLKVYVTLSRPTYFALAGEAKRLGVPFAGHVPLLVGASEAAIAGQRSEEHRGVREQELSGLAVLSPPPSPKRARAA